MTKNNARKLGRRDLLKVMTAGAGALTISAFLPKKWVKPVVDFGVSPVHAQASGELTGSISGTIYSNLNQGLNNPGLALTGSPMAGVVVSVDGLGLSSNVTGGDGKFLISNVPVGLQHISCTPPSGFAASSPNPSTNIPVTVDAATIVVQDFLFAVATGTIGGTIYSDQVLLKAQPGISIGNNPLAGMVVTVDGLGLTSNVTGADGGYYIYNVPVGPQHISCIPPLGLFAFDPNPSTAVPVTVNASTPVFQDFLFTIG